MNAAPPDRLADTNGTADTNAAADAWPLVCPVCERPLHTRTGALACAEGHSFDIAKEGYVNLLAPQHRTRGLEGDVAEMLRARRRFLGAGYYAPLRELVADIVEDALQAAGSRHPGDRACVLETGCGEGYYIGGVAARLGERSPMSGRSRVTLLGTDLSRPAVKSAARRYPNVSFFVSDVNRRIYVEMASVDVGMDIFAPRNPDELARIIQPQGRLVIVVPGTSHLRGVRDKLGLLGVQEDKERHVLDRLADSFELADRRELTYSLELDTQAASDLATMGPSYWHRAGKDLADTSEAKFASEASFVLLTFRRP